MKFLYYFVGGQVSTRGDSKSQITNFSFQLKTDTNSPDMRDLKRPFLADNAAFVPGGGCHVQYPWVRRCDYECTI